MKKKRNRVLGLLLILVCIAGLVAVPVLASETKEMQESEEDVWEETASLEMEDVREMDTGEIEITTPEQNNPEKANAGETGADSASSVSTADPANPAGSDGWEDTAGPEEPENTEDESE